MAVTYRPRASTDGALQNPAYRPADMFMRGSAENAGPLTIFGPSFD